MAAAGQFRALAPQLPDSAATMSSTKPATDREPAASAWRSTAGSCDSANAVRIQYAHTMFCPAW